MADDWDGTERRQPQRPPQPQQSDCHDPDLASQLARMDGKLDSLIGQLTSLNATASALDSRLRVAEIGLAELRAREQRDHTPSQWPNVLSVAIAALMALLLVGQAMFESQGTP